MPVHISIKLFSQPIWELKDAEPTPDNLRDLADILSSRLRHIAKSLDKLLYRGWVVVPVGTYDVHLIKQTSFEDAAQELEAAGMSELIRTMTVHK
jgi:hypothetical protein